MTSSTATLAASRALELVNAIAHGLYRLGLRRAVATGVPVVSVGNIALGGTGKTPLVAALAATLQAAGACPAVLTRGYRREDPRPVLVRTPADADWRRVGDEPAMLARQLPGLLVAVDADRAAGARAAIGAGATHLVLDDGFQHWRIARDLDVVVVDGSDPLCAHRPRRESPRALRRASAIVVVTPSGRPPDEGVETARRSAPHARICSARVVPLRVHRGAATAPAASLAGRRLLAGAAIAAPQRFAATLAALGAEVVRLAARPDHHPWRRDELDELLREAGRSGAELIVTAKDAVKLPADIAARLAWLEIGLEPVDLAWEELLAPVLPRRATLSEG